MTTDHTRNTVTAFLDPPSEGILANLRYQLKYLLLSIGITIARTLLLIVLYALWIPFLIWALGWILTH